MTKQPHKPIIHMANVLLSRAWTISALAQHLRLKPDTASKYLREAEQEGWMKLSYASAAPKKARGNPIYLYTPLFKLVKTDEPHQGTATDA